MELMSISFFYPSLHIFSQRFILLQNAFFIFLYEILPNFLLHSLYLLINYLLHLRIGNIICFLQTCTFSFMILDIVFQNRLFTHWAISKYNRNFTFLCLYNLLWIIEFYDESWLAWLLYYVLMFYYLLRYWYDSIISLLSLEEDLFFSPIPYFLSDSRAIIRIFTESLICCCFTTKDNILTLSLKRILQIDQFLLGPRKAIRFSELSLMHTFIRRVICMETMASLSQTKLSLDRILYSILIIYFFDVSSNDVIVELLQRLAIIYFFLLLGIDKSQPLKHLLLCRVETNLVELVFEVLVDLGLISYWRNRRCHFIQEQRQLFYNQNYCHKSKISLSYDQPSSLNSYQKYAKYIIFLKINHFNPSSIQWDEYIRK